MDELKDIIMAYLNTLDPDDISRERVEDVLYDALNAAEQRLIL